LDTFFTQFDTEPELRLKFDTFFNPLIKDPEAKYLNATSNWHLMLNPALDFLATYGESASF
jgi:hypothetical protein